MSLHFEQELAAARKALRECQAARANAERTSALKDEFLAIVSHELRSPLGAILGWAHMLRRRSGEEEFNLRPDTPGPAVGGAARFDRCGCRDRPAGRRGQAHSRRQSAGPVGRSALRRPGPAAAGRGEPAGQRGEIHARGGPHQDRPAARGPLGRFRQADPTAARRRGGLGLAIARHLVELHGGEIHAESAGEGQGATFVLRLPLAD